MTREQIRYLLDTYKEETLLQILMNNGKRFSLTPDERKKGLYTFDDSRELIIYKERFNGIDTIHTAPYEFVESLIFKDGAQATFEDDPKKPGLLLDDKGKPIVRPANEW